MNKYDSIINYPHYELKKHMRMSIENRAAQFAPFAALAGYSDTIIETGRLTNKKKEISEDMKYYIDMKLKLIENRINENPQITVTYFEKDKRKSGGKYLEYTGNIKNIDVTLHTLKFIGGKIIELNSIYDLKVNL